MTQPLHDMLVYMMSIDPPQMIFWALVGAMFKWVLIDHGF